VPLTLLFGVTVYELIGRPLPSSAVQWTLMSFSWASVESAPLAVGAPIVGGVPNGCAGADGLLHAGDQPALFSARTWKV
jgi:hypothetical protein